MELRMQSHRWEARPADWTAAAVAGFAAGAVLMVLELLWSTASGAESPFAISHRVAGIMMGPEVARGTDFDVTVVTVALVTHYLLGIAFGLILGAVIAPFHLDSSMGMSLLTGALYGLLLYLFSFYGLARVFPWFMEMRGTAALSGHIVFGMAAASMYRQLARAQAA